MSAGKFGDVVEAKGNPELLMQCDRRKNRRDALKIGLSKALGKARWKKRNSTFEHRLAPQEQWSVSER